MTTIDEARLAAIQERTRSIESDAEADEHRAARVNAKQRHLEMITTALDTKVRQLEDLAYSQSVLLAEQSVQIAELQARLNALGDAREERSLAEVEEDLANAARLAQRALQYPAFRTV